MNRTVKTRNIVGALDYIYLQAIISVGFASNRDVAIQSHVLVNTSAKIELSETALLIYNRHQYPLYAHICQNSKKRKKKKHTQFIIDNLIRQSTNTQHSCLFSLVERSKNCSRYIRNRGYGKTSDYDVSLACWNCLKLIMELHTVHNQSKWILPTKIHWNNLIQQSTLEYFKHFLLL